MGVRGSAKRRRRAPSSSAGANTKGESRFPPISGVDGNALERKSKQRRTTEPSAGPSGAGSGADLISCLGADLISCLGDDVLVRVLELLPDARDAFVVTLEDLPSSAKMETMRLALDGAAVRLPAAATFAALVELSLRDMEFKDGNGLLLSRLLSSACCPRLRKLSLRDVRFTRLEELLRLAGFQALLLLEAGTLSELSFEDMVEPGVLQLRTPNLRVLRINHSCLNELVISHAPRLEILMIDGLPDRIDVDGDLPRVRKIEQVSEVIKGRIPHLPNATSLTVQISQFELHSFGDGVSDILAQCNNLKYLCLDLNCFIADLQRKNPKLDLTCHHQDHWKTHEISLVHLKEVELKGLTGTNCELWFMQSVISGARDLEKLAITFNREYRPEDRNEAFDLTSLVGDGVWTDCHGAYLSYEWRPFQ
uniref:FBD domain-containing protein n=1 Tax=Setaria viridis TaxID=4556 RepID=A0A4V6D4I0_SETVI|nr:hypothetical protein SEVIR_7G249400v2 [Setaria viridis]